MMERLTCAVVLLCCAIPCHAQQPEGKNCETAVAYAGPPLHEPLAPNMLPDGAVTLDGELDSSLTQRFEATLDWVLANTNAPGITAAVGIPGQGRWSSAHGKVSTTPPTPLAEPAVFYWASAGKLFTATVVMQLIESDKLAYDAPLARWYPDFPNAQSITIEHLLTHTNGIFSFNSDPAFRQLPGYVSPETALAVAARHGCVCCPGEQWYYSNTGYVLLAKIVEAIEGRPFHEVVQARIVEPLKLSNTLAQAPRQKLAGLPVGHVAGTPLTSFDPTTPYGAGCIAATAEDMVTFLHALLTSKLLQRKTVEAALEKLYPMFGPATGQYYGRGIMLYDVPEKDGNRLIWIGHSGGTPGHKAVVAYDTSAKVFVAVAMNGDAPAEAVANRLLHDVKSDK